MNQNINESQVGDRSFLVTVILAIFGFTGIHRLYTGHVLLALIYVFTGGIFLIGYFFDFFMLLSGGYRDVSGKRLN